MSIQRWGLSTKWAGQLRWVKSKAGDWCKYYADVEPLEQRIITLEQTNRLLCRDLDEAQLRIEELRGGIDKRVNTTKGCVLAAAEACRVFDQPVIAEHILAAAGITDAELQQCAEYDLRALRKAGLTKIKSNL